jgi:hypothetical protein
MVAVVVCGANTQTLARENHNQPLLCPFVIGARTARAASSTKETSMRSKTLPRLLFSLALTAGLSPFASADQDANYPWMQRGPMAYGMGHGMMMGPGMMGYGMMGMDPGMMGYGHLGPIGMLDLKDEQVNRSARSRKT